jgi:hypothetical protein
MHAIARLTTVLLLSALPRLLGQNAFTKVTTGEIATDVRNSYACAWGDFNGDGWIDLFVPNAWGHPNDLYRNDGDGCFETMLNEEPALHYALTYGCCWGDYHNDGFLDLFVAAGGGGPPDDPPEANLLYRNNGNANAGSPSIRQWP